MVEFNDLPVELLTNILGHLIRPHHLTLVCRVNRTFHTFGIPFLYAWVHIASWHKNPKYRGWENGLTKMLVQVVQLFETLSSNPKLASYVRKLEIRDFPRVPLPGAVDAVLGGISNCVNLISCTWTRDGTLSTMILEELQKLPKLAELEINGHCKEFRYYDPEVLIGFSQLKKIGLIMPEPSLINGKLERWIVATNHGLVHLNLICKSSPLVTDEILESIAPYLDHLETLSLTGCTHITHKGVFSAISHNKLGIRSLALEGISTRFEMSQFAALCSSTDCLKELRSITLTVQEEFTPQANLKAKPVGNYFEHLQTLLSGSSLTHFQIYASQIYRDTSASNAFFRDLIAVHGKRLKRFSIHRMLIGLDVIRDICENCEELEQLFLVVMQTDLINLAPCLSPAKKLRIVHLNHPHRLQASVPSIFLPSDALKIVRDLGPSVVQFGCNAKVWQVGSQVTLLDNGEVVSERVLLPYESLQVPEAFLVVRT